MTKKDCPPLNPYRTMSTEKPIKMPNYVLRNIIKVVLITIGVSAITSGLFVNFAFKDKVVHKTTIERVEVEKVSTPTIDPGCKDKTFPSSDGCGGTVAVECPHKDQVLEHFYSDIICRCKR